MNTVAIKNAARLPAQSYGDLIGAAVADKAGRESFLRMSASEQAFGLAVFAAAGKDDAMMKKLTAEFQSLRQPQYIALEHVSVTLNAAARMQRQPWIVAALSGRDPRPVGGAVGKRIR